jgi:large-conductance mechanosensitive channel
MLINIIYYKFYSDLQKFIFSNNILVTASGFSIGIATKEVIEKILNAIIIPSINWILTFFHIKYLMKYEILNNSLYIIWSILIWIITIIFTFVLLEYFLNQTIFGLKGTIKQIDTVDFIKSKTEAKLDNIIPITQEDQNYIKNEKNQDDNILKKTQEEGKSKINKIIDDETKKILETFQDLDPYTNNFSPVNFLL